MRADEFSNPLEPQVLVHGESNAMGRLKSALQSKYSEREENIKIYTPKNCETLKLHFRGEKMAKVRTSLDGGGFVRFLKRTFGCYIMRCVLKTCSCITLPSPPPLPLY